MCRANAQQPKLFVGMILILIFAEALALYGLIGESPLWSSSTVIAQNLGAGRSSAVLWCLDNVRQFSWLTISLCMRIAVGIILASKAGTATPGTA